jgi:hypothetical protein
LTPQILNPYFHTPNPKLLLLNPKPSTLIFKSQILNPYFQTANPKPLFADPNPEILILKPQIIIILGLLLDWGASLDCMNVNGLTPAAIVATEASATPCARDELLGMMASTATEARRSQP